MAANRFYSPAQVDSTILTYTPNFQLIDNVLTTLQGDYDKLVEESLKFPEHWARDREGLQAEIQRREGGIDDLASKFANKDFMAGRVGMRKLARDYKKDWLPGGVYHQASVRKQQVDDYKKRVQEDFKDAPHVGAMLIDRLNKESEPIINPDGSFGKLKTSNYVKHYTDEEINDYINKNLKEIKDTLIGQGYDARRISEAQTWHQLYDVMGRDFEDVYNVISQRMSPEMIASVQQSYDARRYNNPDLDLPEQNMADLTLERDEKGRIVGPKNVMQQMLLGAAQGRARKDLEKNFAIGKEDSVAHKYRKLEIDYENFLENPELPINVYQNPSGYKPLPKLEFDGKGNVRMPPKAKEGQLAMPYSSARMEWGQTKPEKEMIAELRANDPMLDRVYQRMENDPHGAFAKMSEGDKYNHALKEHEYLFKQNSIVAENMTQFLGDERKRKQEDYVERGALNDLILIPLYPGNNGKSIRYSDAVREHMGIDKMSKDDKWKKGTFVTGRLKSTSTVAPGGLYVQIEDKSGRQVQYAAVPNTKEHRIKSPVGKLHSAMYSPMNEDRISEVYVPTSDGTFETVPVGIRTRQTRLSDQMKARIDAEGRLPTDAERRRIRQLERNPSENLSGGKEYELYNVGSGMTFDGQGGRTTNYVIDDSSPFTLPDGRPVTLEMLDGFAEAAAESSFNR